MAIPAYIDLYGKRPIRIDDEIYNETILKEYYKIVPSRIRFGIEQKDPDIIYKMKFRLQNGDLINGIYGNLIYKNKETDSYKYLHELKMKMLSLGVLCYEDAYYLANYYLEKYSQIKEVFSKRFSYVFIDEMQDTMSHQNDILNRLFDDSVVVQRIGDTNQSIYDNRDAEGTWNIIEPSLSISESKRFSRSIANIVRNICVDPQDLKGNPNIPDIQPTIIVFNRETIDRVIPYFGDMILRNQLEKEVKPIFKAVGWVTNENPKYDTLLDYWKGFNKGVKQRIDFDHLSSYLTPLSPEDVSKEGASLYKQSIIKGILKSLRLMEKRDKNNRFFTTQSLLNFLKEEHEEIYEELLLKLAKWCLAIQNGEDVHKEVKEFIESELKTVFNWGNNGKLVYFFEVEAEKQEILTSLNPNIYTYSKSKTDIEIELDTIHGVKGETHTATLYLETFYHKYDISRILYYLKGNHESTDKKRTLQNLKMTYVGLTRPTHLLCVAVHEETIKDHEEDLKKAGWNIEYVSKLDQ
ncbi:UvrD-helicase domain-containing protein [Sediminibacillus albus]|uniref:UvrD/REP helicase N-terminal domain-containing protein n=1 Tax=Sediminibacillus albus TaxID=407036 RepID=A0A1G9AJX7_9BACI|nr:UvrD-helicase domain-containing protein [Sediminibacillus albus]SDK26880.1 UvrD/REP helicase N-terminal domain-containing protein [Sediminibacillus albus]